MSDPDAVWGTMTQAEKVLVLANYRQNVPKQQACLLLSLPKDILLRCIAPHFSRDCVSWLHLGQTCKRMRDATGDGVKFYLERIADKTLLNPFVMYMIHKANLSGNKLRLILPRTFDEKCRYINVGIFHNDGGSCKIDKYTGLILNDESKMPRGYVTNVAFTSMPELCWTGTGHLLSIKEMMAKIPHFDDRRVEMSKKLADATRVLNAESSRKRKRMFVNTWRDSSKKRLEQLKGQSFSH